jgi:hypothetical protein
VSHSSFAGSGLARLPFKGRASIAVRAGLAFAGLIPAATLLGAGVSAHRPPLQARSQTAARPANQASAPADHSRVNASYAALPLAFEPNVGQTDSQVKYLARGRGYSLFLTSTSAYFAVPVPSQPARVNSPRPEIDLAAVKRDGHHATAASERHTAVASIEMDLIGSNPQPHISAGNQLPGLTNYILGRDPSKWRSGIAHYGQVRYHDVYPGVDLAYHGAAQVPTQGVEAQANDKFEFDFLINPGASPDAVRLGFRGPKGLRTGVSGDLVIASAAGDLHLHRPFAYQELNGKRQSIDARFVIHADNRVSFALGNYDRNRQLVIDPTVTYSTYLGGSMEDDGNAIAVDGSGNAYITGQTDSTDFPAHGGVVATAGGFDVFVTELNPLGAIVFTTLVGGSGDDIGNAIAVDTNSSPAGIYIAGQTGSSDFPTTSSVVQPTFFTGVSHGFVSKISSDGSTLLWSTFVEGSGGDGALGLAIVRDASVPTDDDVFVVGNTQSTDLGSRTPGTNGTVNPLPQGGSLNNGAGANGSVDGFIAKLSNGGAQYLFLSYLGGSSDDVAFGVALDPTGKIYVAGQTSSEDFYTTPANVFQPQCGTDGHCNASGGNVVDDAFVVAISSANPPAYIYSTYLGGEAKDDAFAVAADSSGNAYITGQTFSTSFPTKNPLTGLSTLVGTQNAFVASLNSAGTALNYSTYLGGKGSEAGDSIAVDSNAIAYVTGYTTSTDFPVTSTTTFGGGGSFGRDAFLSELSLGGTTLSLPFSTYLGGSGDEDILSGGVTVDAFGRVYVTGDTNSANFPLVNATDQTYNAGSSSTCAPTGGSLVPCPDAFVTVYAPNPDFSIAGTSLTSVTAGGSSTSTITIVPLHNYSDTVNLTCSVTGGGTPAPTCAFSSNSVSGGSGSSTLTVSTTAATALLQFPGRRSGTILVASFLPIAGFALLGVSSSSRKSWRRIARFLCLSVLASLVLILPACGGGSSGGGGGGGGGGSAGTPSGTYTIIVTGTDGTITHSITPALTLTVN